MSKEKMKKENEKKMEVVFYGMTKHFNEKEMNWKNKDVEDWNDKDKSDYEKYKENKNKETLNLLNKIGTWGMRLSENEDAWIYDIGLIQNYAWELKESYKKLSKHLAVENLIS